MPLFIIAWALAMISMAKVCPGPRQSVEACFSAAYEYDRIISLLICGFLDSLLATIRALFIPYSLASKTSFVFPRE